MCSRSAPNRPLMTGEYLDEIIQDGLRWLAAMATACGMAAVLCLLAWAVM